MELRNLPEYKQLLELKRLKKQTLRDIQDDKEGVRHVGYKVTTATRWQPISKPSKWLCQGPPDMCTPCGLMCVSDDDDAAACKAPISAVSDEAACCLSLNVAWGVFRTDTQQPGVKKKKPNKKTKSTKVPPQEVMLFFKRLSQDNQKLFFSTQSYNCSFDPYSKKDDNLMQPFPWRRDDGRLCQ